MVTQLGSSAENDRYNRVWKNRHRKPSRLALISTYQEVPVPVLEACVDDDGEIDFESLAFDLYCRLTAAEEKLQNASDLPDQMLQCLPEHVLTLLMLNGTEHVQKFVADKMQDRRNSNLAANVLERTA